MLLGKSPDTGSGVGHDQRPAWRSCIGRVVASCWRIPYRVGQVSVAHLSTVDFCSNWTAVSR